MAEGIWYEFQLTGVSSLLMCQDNLDFAEKLKAWREDPDNRGLSKAGDDRTPPWTWIGATYLSEDHVALPTDNLAVAIRQAATKLIMKGKKTFKEDSVSGLWFKDEFLPIVVNGKTISADAVRAFEGKPDYASHVVGVRKLGFELFAKRATVGMSKHVRVRPMFKSWACSGRVEVTTDTITAEVLAKIFELSGRVGVGSWRPGGKTPGRYGMFETVVRKV